MQKLGKLIIAGIAVLAMLYYALVTYVVPGYLKNLLPEAEELAQQYVNGSVQIGEVRWDGGLSAEIDNVIIQDESQQKVIVLPKTIVNLRPWLALDNPARAVSKITLLQPQVHLTMDEQGRWNMQNLLKSSSSEETPFYGLLQVKDCALRVATPYGSWDFTVNAEADGGANPNFALKVDVLAGQDKLRLQGLVTTKGVGNLHLKTDQLHLAAYAALAEHYGQVRALQGSVDKLQLTWVNDGQQVRLSGKGLLNGVAGRMTAAGSEHQLQLAGQIDAEQNKVNTADLKVMIDQQPVTVRGEADLRDLDNISGSGSITAAKLQWQDWQGGKINIQAVLADNTLQLQKAELSYGGGSVKMQGSYDLQDSTLIANVDFDNVTQQIAALKNDSITASGGIALLAQKNDDIWQLHAAGDTFNIKWRSLLINKLGFDGSFDGQKLTVAHLGALAGKGSLAASGMVTVDGDVQLNGRMAQFPVDPFLEFSGYRGSGLCSTGFSVGGTLSAPEFTGIVQLTDVSFMEQKLNEAHGLISLKDNVLRFKDFQANMDQGRHVVNGSIDLRGEEPVFDLAVETDGVRAEPLIAVAYPQLKLTGNIDNIVQLRGTLSDLDLDGEVRLTDGSAEGYLIDSVAGRYSYHNQQLRLQNFVIQALSTEVILDGVMDAQQQLDFQMDARNISLNRLPVMDKDVALDGYINAHGYLKGTLSRPYFMGQVTSDLLSINGEVLSDLEGNVTSNGYDKNELSVSFKQPYNNESGDYGLFKAELNINIPQRFMQGKVVTLWGNLGSILRMCKQNYNIDGTVQGEVDINPRGKGSGIDIDIWTEDVKVHDLNYYRMMFKGRLQNGILSFDNVKIMEQKDVEDQGVVAVKGQVDFRQRMYNVEIGATKANPAITTFLMQDPPEIKGQADMLIQVNGPFDNPSGSCSLEINNGSVAGVGIDKLTALMSLQNDHLQLQQFIASKDVYNIKASGDIPLDVFRDAASRRNPNAQMHIVMDLNDARLGILPAMTDMVEWGIGDTQGEIVIGGTLEEPLVNGSVKINDGSVKVKNLDTVIDNIQTDIEFKGNEMLLHNLSAQLGKGTVTASGSYALRASEKDTYKLSVTAEDAELVSELFTGRINSNIEIIPQRYHVFGDGNQPPQVAYRPMFNGSVRLDDVLVNMPTLPEFGEGSSNMGMDMQIDLGPKVHLFNKYLYDIWLAGNMHITGSTVFPIIDGSIKADHGSVTYLRTPFKIKNASVGWAVPGTFLPTVNMEAEARFSRYDIFMRINGPVETMELHLGSNPPLSENTIIRMLTLQRDTSGGEDVTGEDLQNLMSAGLQMAVLGDVEMLVKQTLGLDQFRIYMGKVRSGIGFESMSDKKQELTQEERSQYNLLVSKYLTDNFMIGYTSSFDGIDRSIFGQYDISRHFNLTYSRSYDLSDEAEDWYGVEYKITF